MQQQGQRLTFREFTESDFRLFYSIFSNAKIMEYAWMDQYRREEDLLPYFQRVLKNNHTSPEKRIAYEYGVFLKSDHSFIGFADLEIHQRNSAGGCGEIGYFLLPDFWGKGFAPEIAEALLQFGFTRLGLHRIAARCNSNNARSEKVMRKAGMVKEGELRKVRFKNGRWDHELHYSILLEEWQRRLNPDE